MRIASISTQRQTRFGQAEIPPPPEGIPEKYKKDWEKLPACCRNFYLNPGKGCCAGQPEPHAQLMETPTLTPAPSTTSPLPPKNIVIRLATGVMDWFKWFFRSIIHDFKKIFLAG
jgi:hypothetical protein